jgi:hypothetical protein
MKFRGFWVNRGFGADNAIDLSINVNADGEREWKMTHKRQKKLRMSSIPKRAVGHSLYLPEHERQVIDLPEHRASAYSESAKPSQLTSLQQSFNLTDYRANYAQTIPGDYHPVAAFKPRNGLTSGNAEFPDLRPARLWRSEYEASRISPASFEAPRAPVRPGFQRKAPVVSVDLGESTAAAAFKNPETREAAETGTFFVPGYQGFVPGNTHNPYVAKYASGARRETREASNITENFQRALPGYTAYLPVNGVNDRDPRQRGRATETAQALDVANSWTLI